MVSSLPLVQRGDMGTRLLPLKIKTVAIRESEEAVPKTDFFLSLL
jgi:hypothetical protein